MEEERSTGLQALGKVGVVGLGLIGGSIALDLREQGIDVSPNRIMVTPGASGALLLIASLLINPGDGMLMADPGYPCNRNFLRLVEGKGQLVPVDASDRYQLTPAKAREAPTSAPPLEAERQCPWLLVIPGPRRSGEDNGARVGQRGVVVDRRERGRARRARAAGRRAAL